MSKKLVTLDSIKKHSTVQVATGIDVCKKNGLCTLQLNFKSDAANSWKTLGNLSAGYFPIKTLYTFACVNGSSPLDSGCLIMITSAGFIQYITSRTGVNYLCTVTYVANEQ